MKRATYRAWKCRLGIHRLGVYSRDRSWFTHNKCKDCNRYMSRHIAATFTVPLSGFQRSAVK